jgi:hypothetical protein
LQKVLVQSAGTLQPWPVAHLVLHEPPQSTSVSLPSLAPSRHAFATQRCVVVLQKALAQSAAALQPRPVAHFVLHEPPQSTSLSVPFLTPSLHESATQRCDVVLQTPLVQSPPAEHPPPVAHLVAHVPPQSTSVSLPSLTPSWQALATQRCVEVLQKVLVQSAAMLQPLPVAHLEVHEQTQCT